MLGILCVNSFLHYAVIVSAVVFHIYQLKQAPSYSSFTQRLLIEPRRLNQITPCPKRDFSATPSPLRPTNTKIKKTSGNMSEIVVIVATGEPEPLAGNDAVPSVSVRVKTYPKSVGCDRSHLLVSCGLPDTACPTFQLGPGRLKQRNGE